MYDTETPTALDAFSTGDGFGCNAKFYGITADSTDADLDKVVEATKQYVADEYQDTVTEEDELRHMLQKFRDTLKALGPNPEREEIEKVVFNSDDEFRIYQVTAVERKRIQQHLNEYFCNEVERYYVRRG